MAVNVTGKCHVGQHRHPWKEFDILERASDADSYELMSMQAGDVPAVEDDLTLLGAVKAGYTVEQAGFPSAIGADDGHQLTGVHRQIHIFNSDNTTETEA